VSFARYLPASAFIPLLILWAGIGEAQKLLVIFIGSLLPDRADGRGDRGATRRDLVEAAYTLGAATRGIVRRVHAARRAPRDRRDAAPGAGLGLDLCDRRRTDRRDRRASAT
jgi:NitT/TauT family transport system permease protein